MSDVKFVIIMMSILLGILVWYVLKMIGISNKYYGEKSFVKIPTVFEVTILNSIGFFELIWIFMTLMSLWLIIYAFINPYNDVTASIIIILMGIIQLAILVFQLCLFLICFKLNGSPKRYFFEPHDRELTILAEEEFSFKGNEIINAQTYCFNLKRSANAKSYFYVTVFNLVNGEKVVFTDILPFYNYLEEYFGNIEYSRIYLKHSELNHYYRWFKSLR